MRGLKIFLWAFTSILTFQTAAISDDARRLDLAEKLGCHIDSAEMIAIQRDQVTIQIDENLKRQGVTWDKPLLDNISSDLFVFLMKAAPAIQKQTTKYLFEFFTEEELETLLASLNTEDGAIVSKSLAKIIGASNAAGSDVILPLMAADIQKIVTDKLPKIYGREKCR